MKIINPLTLLFLLSFVTAHAQVSFPKGTQSLNGSVYYYENSDKNSTKTTSYPSGTSYKNGQAAVSVEWGHFIKHNLSLNTGIYGNYVLSENSYSYWNNLNGGSQTSKNSNSTFEGLLGLGLTKYYPIGKSNFAFAIVTSIRGGMGRNFLRQNNSFGTDNKTTYNVFSGYVYVAPQLLYLITPKWSLTGTFGGVSYRYSKTFSLGNDDYEAARSRFFSSLGINSFSIGMAYFINH
ncbi:hypothetical protein AEM51_06640 [Bacteroidetes bacterium UKL13-3]|nr:hypothetical protein AEM51_06640 [Bacteroidetes bacterium UKL13-3]HCP93412.1 hypothetical protein [Bacteroidota bacterium]